MSDYILCHHGIKGQKWGVRRFQKKDGSLTPAGKKRYMEPQKGDGYFVKKAKKNYDLMTDEEFYKKYKITKKHFANRMSQNKSDRAVTDAAATILQEEKNRSEILEKGYTKNAQKALKKYEKYDAKDSEYFKKYIESEKGSKLEAKYEKKWDKYGNKSLNYLEKATELANKAKVESQKQDFYNRKFQEVRDLDLKPGKDYVARYFTYYDGVVFYQERKLKFTSEKGRA